MADNVQVSEGTGKIIATDEITIDGATVHVQRVKPVHGASGTGVDVSTANPMPVKLGDGTNSPAIKPASTTAVAADPAMVVVISPNQTSVPIAGTVSITGAVTVGGSELTGIKADLDAIVADTAPAPVKPISASNYFNAAAGATKYLVAAGAQVLSDYYLENPDATNKLYVQFFNAATTAAVTLGTTVPVRSLGLLALEKANLSLVSPWDFPLGIVIAGTTTATGATTAVTGAVVNIGYRAA